MGFVLFVVVVFIGVGEVRVSCVLVLGRGIYIDGVYYV